MKGFDSRSQKDAWLVAASLIVIASCSFASAATSDELLQGDRPVQAASEQPRGSAFWCDVEYLFYRYGSNPNNWPDGAQKQHVDQYLYLNYGKPANQFEFVENLLVYGVFHSPNDAASDLAQGMQDAWGNPYDRILASSPDGNKVGDVLRAPLINVGIPLYNADLNGKSVIAIKADIHSQGADAFRQFNGKDFLILADTIDLMGAPGTKYGVDDMTRAIASSHCERANVFVGDESVVGLPSNVSIDESGLRAKLFFGASPRREEIHVYPVPSGHTLQDNYQLVGDIVKTVSSGYFGQMAKAVPNPLAGPRESNSIGTKDQVMPDRSRPNYLVLPAGQGPSTEGHSTELGQWRFEPDPNFAGWVLGRKVEAGNTVTVPVYEWSSATSAFEAARAIQARQTKEYPDGIVNVVIYGDPQSERNRQLSNALGSQNGRIVFVKDGALYSSTGALLQKDFVPAGYQTSATQQVAEAARLLQQTTGTKAFGVVPVGDGTSRARQGTRRRKDGRGNQRQFHQTSGIRCAPDA